MRGIWFGTSVAAAALASSSASGTTIAVTEIMTGGSPVGGNDAEYIELYNYGQATVDLTGYQVIDNSLDSGNPRPDRIAVFPAGISIAPDEYIVIARNLQPFLDAFPGVEGNVQAYGWSSNDVADLVTGGLATDGRFGLSSNSDEVIVMDPNDNILWRAAYSTGSDGDSYYLADSAGFSVNMYGAESDFQNPGGTTPAIVVGGNDTGTGVLGYELSSTDANARLFAGGYGSPGGIPEPTTAALLGLGGLCLLRRRA